MGMWDHVVALLAVCAFCIAACVGQGLYPSVQSDGTFNILMNGQVWLSGAYTKLFFGGKWYSSADHSLKLFSYELGSGFDYFGQNNIYTFTWYAGEVEFVTYVKVYPENRNLVVFGQTFVSGLTNCSISNSNQPLSIFPAMNVVPKLGFLHFDGGMAGMGIQTGIFPATYVGGLENGPLALFDSNLTTVVMSPLSYFLSAITNINSTDKALISGVQGEVRNIPAGFNIEYILYAGQGVNNAMMGWGDMLLQRYGKTRVLPTASIVLQYLGYSTTGYYFYNPLDGNSSYGNYEDTLLQFNDYSTKLGIPYHYYLLDSWWYGEYGLYNGVWKWEDAHDLLEYRFPHGLEWLRDRLGMPFAAHMGKWVSSTPYAKNESYGFIVEKEWAIPTSANFFDYIFQNASGWGLNTIKQDHISEQILDMEATMTDVTTAREWLLSEGKALSQHGINIEYCMDWSSVLLTSLDNPTATHSRAGGDYVPAQASWQWKIGTTSMFLWAIGLYPDKDTFYTTVDEVTVNPKAPFYNFTESYPLTHAIASSMSAGPITPSDGIGGTDKVLIMRMCAADGLLLKPDRPAINIESTWIQRTFGPGGAVGPKGEVLTSYTEIGPVAWHYAFGAQLAAPYSFLASDLLLPITSGKYTAFLFNATNDLSIQVVPFGEGAPVVIPQGTNYGDAYFWVFSPVFPNGWTFLGETNKFITVSKQRFKTIVTTPNDVQILLAGQQGESVRLTFLPPSSDTPQSYTCNVGNSGFSSFSVLAKTCADA